MSDNLAKSEILWKLHRTETVIDKLKKHQKRFDVQVTSARDIFPAYKMKP